MTALEVGSDMAGSTRIPAAFCGVYGLKTTEHRVPSTGFFFPAEAGPRAVRIISTLGPIARDLDDLELCLRVISGPDGRDGDVPAVPLNSQPPTPLRGRRLAVIEQEAKDDRHLVNKAVSMALISVGKRRPTLLPDVLSVAQRLSESDNSHARRIGKKALREFAG